MAIRTVRFGLMRGSYGWNGGLGTIWLSDPVARSALILLMQVTWIAPHYPDVCREFLVLASAAAGG